MYYIIFKLRICLDFVYIRILNCQSNMCDFEDWPLKNTRLTKEKKRAKIFYEKWVVENYY